MSAEHAEVTGQAAEATAVRTRAADLEDCRHRVAALERQRSELLEVNKKWDEQYQRSKRLYEAKIQELRKRLAACEARAPEEEELGRKNVHLGEKLSKRTVIEQTTVTPLVCLSERDSLLFLQKGNSEEAEKQAESLRLQVTTLTRRGQQQQSEIRRLNKVLSARLEEETEGSTQVELLRQQVRFHEEDFLKERAEREQLCERNVELERRLEMLQAELQKGRAQVTRVSVCTPYPRSHAPCGCRQRDGPPAVAGGYRARSPPRRSRPTPTPETRPEPSR